MKFFQVAVEKMDYFRIKYNLIRLSLNDVVLCNCKFDTHPQTGLKEKRPVLMWQSDSKYMCYYEIPIIYTIKAKQNARFLFDIEYTWDSDEMWKNAESEIKEYFNLDSSCDSDLSYYDDSNLSRASSPGLTPRS